MGPSGVGHRVELAVRLPEVALDDGELGQAEAVVAAHAVEAGPFVGLLQATEQRPSLRRAERHVRAQVVDRPGHQHPVPHRLGFGDRLAQGVAGVGVMARELAHRRGPLHEGLGPDALGADGVGLDDGPLRPLDGVLAAGPDHVELGQPRHGERPILARPRAPRPAPPARPWPAPARRRGPSRGGRGPGCGAAAARSPAVPRPGHPVPLLDVGQRLVVEAEQPRRPRRDRQQLGVVGRLGEGVGRQPQRLVAGPAGQVRPAPRRGPGPRTRRSGRRRRRGGRAAARSSHGDWRSACSATSCSRRRSRPSSCCSTASRTRAWRKVNESSHVLHQQAPVEQPPQDADQLVLGGAGHVGQQVELGPAAEHGGRLDQPALARRRGRRAGRAPARPATTAAAGGRARPGRRRRPR